MKKVWLISAVAAALLISGCGGDDIGAVNNPDIGGGKILFYTTSGEYKGAANVGNLPDMVTFSHDGSFLVSANEGEPSSDYISDPKGSISIIEIDATKDELVRGVTTLTFDDVTIPVDVRIKPGASASADLEPEYVAITEDDKKAFVSLQENNAIAYVDLKSKQITAVKSLGEKDFHTIDVDIVADDAAVVAPAPDGVVALYMPDTIAAYSVGGADYFVTANEGDDREYDAWEDTIKAKDVGDLNRTLDVKFNATAIDGGDSKKLEILKDMGVVNNVYEKLYLAGTRSFSIWDAQGTQVFDSNAFESLLIDESFTTYYQIRVDDADYVVGDESNPMNTVVGGTTYFWDDPIDARALKKGVEPEALALAKIGAKVFAYVGFEKQGGFVVYDVTNPAAATKVEYFNDIDYTKAPDEAGDLAPEGMVTFTQDGSYYLAIANELSSTVALYQLAADGKVTKLNSLKVGTFGEGAAEILSYDPDGKALFATNAEEKRVEIIDVTDPANPVVSGNIDFSDYADNLQSVSVKNGLVAIAVKRK